MTGAESPWLRMLTELLDQSHLVTAARVPRMLSDVLAPLGVQVELFVVDYDQVELRPLPGATSDAVRVAGTLPGRAYQLGIVLDGRDEAGRAVLWVPLVDGVERLGLMRVALPDRIDPADPVLRERLTAVSSLIAHVLVSKNALSDVIPVARRTQPMSVASELLWQLLPPLTAGSPELAITAVLEPAYEVSGDGFDYTLDEHEAHVAIFDSSGHDLSAGLTTAVTLAAARTARREGKDLLAVATCIDAALTDQFPGFRFVTGILATLDAQSGHLRYLNAGHPPPVLIRAGKAVRALEGGGRLPFGRVASLMPADVTTAEEYLEPGDLVLLHSDGVVEARDDDGREFGVERLVELAERAAADRLPAAETLRRLTQAVQVHRRGPLRDDATLVLVEWSGQAATRLLPRPDGDTADRSDRAV